jgi:hypothetical protein
VTNRHNDQSARDCLVYVEKIIDLKSGKEVTPPEIVEIKWKGVTTSRVTIPPRAKRSFDAVYVNEDQPALAYLGINSFIVDYKEYVYCLPLPGEYELTFVVYSNDFPSAREKIILDSDGGPGIIKFYKSGRSPVKHARPDNVVFNR